MNKNPRVEATSAVLVIFVLFVAPFVGGGNQPFDLSRVFGGASDPAGMAVLSLLVLCAAAVLLWNQFDAPLVLRQQRRHDLQVVP